MIYIHVLPMYHVYCRRVRRSRFRFPRVEAMVTCCVPVSGFLRQCAHTCGYCNSSVSFLTTPVLYCTVMYCPPSPQASSDALHPRRESRLGSSHVREDSEGVQLRGPRGMPPVPAARGMGWNESPLRPHILQASTMTDLSSCRCTKFMCQSSYIVLSALCL